MAKAKKGLGRGLGAFFGDDVVTSVVKEESTAYKTSSVNGTEKKGEPNVSRADEKNVLKENEGQEYLMKLSKIEPNADQPRKDFKDDQLQELAESIKKYGVLQPLLVQKKGDLFEIVAGERRWRAAKIAGLKEVPIVVKEYNPQQAMEIALIENVQRENLNPIEEAAAYQRLMQEFGLKQEEIAERVSKNRSTITNCMRLLKLDPEVQKLLAEGAISSGHARALLGLEDTEKQIALARMIVEKKLSVREVEREVKRLSKSPKEKQTKEKDQALELIFQELEERMKSVMGTKVNINRKDKSKGRVEIEYYSEEELERIVELIESVRND